MRRREIYKGAYRVVLGAAALVLLAPTSGRLAHPPDTLTDVLAPRHITLESSIPGDEEAVDGAVKEIRLFFSDAPLMRGASIRIVDSSRKLIRSTPPEADSDDPKQLAVQIPQALAEGTYVVQWRCIADDGHVMRGSFRFDVVGH